MDANELRALQAPIKERYRSDPHAAVVTLKAKGTLDDTNVACKIETGRALAVAGLHPATGGSGLELCSAICCWKPWLHAPGSRSRRWRPRSIFRSRPAGCRRKAISISAARLASPRMRRSASARSACASISIPMRHRTNSINCSSSPNAIVVYQTVKAGPPVDVKLARV